MNLFEKFVRENVDQPASLSTEHIIKIPAELSKAFEHVCRKRNQSFNEAVHSLIKEAVDKDQKPQKTPSESPADPDPVKFMGDDVWR